MSEPKRYGFPDCECDATDEFYMEEKGMCELLDGGFVKWEDYDALRRAVIAVDNRNAALQFENERIRNLFAETNRLMLLDGQYEAAQVGTYNKLNDEVQRLRHENTTMRVERMQDETGKRITYADYARLKAELASIRSQFANSEWQPIETAPKDCKTQILAWCKEFDHLFIVNYTGTEGMWYVSCSEGYIRPTHWMHLPKPPIS